MLETFALSDPYIRGIQQGLWLESLASDIVASHTDFVWTGQMVETNEIDVLGIVADHVILVECKDTSFGQNDLYVTSVKAQQVDANVVIVVSTRDIHQNVRDGIERMNRDNSNREFRVVTNCSASAIRQELNDAIGEFYGQQIQSWSNIEDDTL